MNLNNTEPTVETKKKVVKPIPLILFSEFVKGGKDEIWLGILRAYHNSEKHTKEEWHSIIDSYRSKPAF